MRQEHGWVAIGAMQPLGKRRSGKTGAHGGQAAESSTSQRQPDRKSVLSRSASPIHLPLFRRVRDVSVSPRKFRAR